MSESDAFRRAIATHPDDDLTRLVYADWLDECGDGDRAAFIRLQCEAAGLVLGSGAAAIALREAAAHFRDYWLTEELPGVCARATDAARCGVFSMVVGLESTEEMPQRIRIRWHRGFVAAVEHGPAPGQWQSDLRALLPSGVSCHAVTAAVVSRWPLAERLDQPNRTTHDV